MDSTREHSAIGVAQNSDLGACIGGDLKQRHAVLRVALVAVEEVLTVDEYPPTIGDEEADGVANHREVLVERGVQRVADVAHIALGDDRDDGSLGGQ